MRTQDAPLLFMSSNCQDWFQQHAFNNTIEWKQDLINTRLHLVANLFDIKDEALNDGIVNKPMYYIGQKDTFD